MISSEDPQDHIKTALWIQFYSDGSVRVFQTKQASDDCMAFPLRQLEGGGATYAHCLARTVLDVTVCKGTGL